MQLIQESETLFGPLPEIMCMETGIGRTKGSRSDYFSMYFAPVMPSCLCMFRRLTEAIIDKGIQLKRHDQSMRTTDCILNIIADGCLTIFGVIGGIDLTRTNENPMMHLHRQNARHKLMAVTLRHFNMHKSRHAVLTVCDPIHRQAVNFVDELLTDDVLTCCIRHYIKRIQIVK